MGQETGAFRLDASLFCHTARVPNFRQDILHLGRPEGTSPYCAKTFEDLSLSDLSLPALFLRNKQK